MTRMSRYNRGMTNTVIALLVLAVLAILAYDRIRYGKAVSQGSTKANTIHAIEQANSKAYQGMVLKSLMVDEVLADMQNDPFWAEYFN